jgi:hypothetical protein
MMKRGNILLSICFLVLAGSCRAEDSAGMLAHILAGKGVISDAELARIEAASPEGRIQLLASLLEEKGVLTREELASLTPAPAPVLASYRPPDPPQAVAPKPPASPRQAAPPVTTDSRFPLQLYGNILTNAVFDTRFFNNEDLPLFAQPAGLAPFNDRSFAMTARQSRFGLHYEGPRVGGAQISGLFEFDLFGGKAALNNGISFDLFRLRLAYGRLEWEHSAFEAGQDWAIFAPLNPISLAEYAIPSLATSGNPWIRLPQFRGEFTGSVSPSTKWLLQIAATDPNVGDFPTAVFVTNRTPLIGERGRGPGAEARLAFTTRSHDRNYTVGLSGVYSHGQNQGIIGIRSVTTGVQTWGVAADWTLPVARKLTLAGEAFGGRALGIFSVGLFQSVAPVGTPGQHGVGAYGGWMQTQFTLNPIWSFNLAYGIELNKPSQLVTGNRFKNQSYVGNVLYKFSPSVTFAFEWRRILTNYQNQPSQNARGDTANIAALYTL